MTIIAPMAFSEIEALNKLLDYNRKDEQRHFEECMEGAKTQEEKDEVAEVHIYSSIQILDAFVERWNDTI